MDSEWCQQTLEKTLEIHGKPEIINRDQRSQLTSELFSDFVLQPELRLSMDGKSRAIDNAHIDDYGEA
jgi:putative transposase